MRISFFRRRIEPGDLLHGAGGYGSQDLQPDNVLLSIEFPQHGIVTGLITPAARTAVRPVRIQQCPAGF